MSTISKQIELYLKLLINNSDENIIEIQRNALAEHFKCVPSQINYVLSTRFTIDQGYFIETRRGGGGFVRIKKLDLGLKERIESLTPEYNEDLFITENIHSFIDRLHEEEFLSKRESFLLKNLFSSSIFDELPEKKSNTIKSSLLRDVLKAITNM
ncbi:MAG: CtsR family transcriptional regulator [Sphingobacteriia bacterium]|nr:CtsR family transcriptional regulator [Sphingobacteriia bacterium]